MIAVEGLPLAVVFLELVLGLLGRVLVHARLGDGRAPQPTGDAAQSSIDADPHLN
ncbi:hypothetical protein D3C73_1486560 [compost metagenome]